MAMAGAMRQPTGADHDDPAGARVGRRGRRTQGRRWVIAVLAALGVLAVIALGVGLALSRSNDNDATDRPTQVADAEADRA